MPKHNDLIEIKYEPGAGEPRRGGSMRLDQFLASNLQQFSRAHLQKLIGDKQVFVDGRAQRASYRLRAGQNIEVRVPPAVASQIKAEAMSLDIIFEDEYLAIVNKPAGMVVHPGAGIHSGTLVHGLLHHMADSLSGIGGVLRPGIVHRLDKDTSGLIVIAKADGIHQHLAKQIQSKEAKRVYLAVLEGELPALSGKVDAAIGRHPTKRTQMTILKDGRSAQTIYKVLSSGLPPTNSLLSKNKSVFSLARLDLKTGRTHQIRVHMASLKCPVVGDLIYNNKTTGNASIKEKLGLIGQALHAHQLSFVHPISNQLLDFKVAPPSDWSMLISILFPKLDLHHLPL